VTEHDVFTALEHCVEKNRTWLLTPDQSASLLVWARDITERANVVVSENHRLIEALNHARAAAARPLEGPADYRPEGGPVGLDVPSMWDDGVCAGGAAAGDGSVGGGG
jgi:hypothetical protein